MSQTEGAKRTRALKYQAKLDALELRGKDDPDWHAFLEDCAKRESPHSMKYTADKTLPIPKKQHAD